MANRNNSRGNRGNRSQASASGAQPTQTVTMERPAHIDNGEDARGNVNSRENQTRTQPEPSPAMLVMGDDEASANVVALRVPHGQKNALDVIHFETTKAYQTKAASISAASQKLAEAADLSEEGEAKSAEAKAAANDAAILLYQARTTGQLSADEVTSLLGDKFGYRVKGGTDKFVPGASGGKEASKTPYGQGEAIRKRLVRAVQAWDFVNNGNGGNFFNGLPSEDVEGVLNRMAQGETGFWAAYEAFAQLKRDNATGPSSPVLDPKRMAALAEALKDEGIAKVAAGNRALLESWTALRDMLNVVGEQVGEILAAKAA